MSYVHSIGEMPGHHVDPGLFEVSVKVSECAPAYDGGYLMPCGALRGVLAFDYADCWWPAVRM